MIKKIMKRKKKIVMNWMIWINFIDYLFYIFIIKLKLYLNYIYI